MASELKSEPCPPGESLESGSPRPWRLEGKRLRRFAFLGALLTIVLLFHRPLFRGNFGVVDPGRVYRSAQPKGNLPALIRTCAPASILNLRGGSNKDDWYLQEVQTTARLGIDFYDYPMSAEDRPTRRQLLTMIDFLSRVRYPLLIHCKQGADRTGLVSALYRMVLMGEPPEVAAGAFTVLHGHIPLGRTSRLHAPLDEYAEWLDASGLEHTAERFRRWVATLYRDPGAMESTESVDPLPPGSRWERFGRTREELSPASPDGATRATGGSRGRRG